MENYEVLSRAGEGAHGIVLKAKIIQTGEIVALKKIALRNFSLPSNSSNQSQSSSDFGGSYASASNGGGGGGGGGSSLNSHNGISNSNNGSYTGGGVGGKKGGSYFKFKGGEGKGGLEISQNAANHSFPNNILREIKALQQLEGHPNIVRLFDVFASGPSVVLVFEFMVTDLSQVLASSLSIHSNASGRLRECQIKRYMKMILEGLAFCHGHGIMHRDLKPANLLIGCNSNGGRTLSVLKLADFGLARVFGGEGRPYSHQVATRWYRAPELLYGARTYTTSVDIWAVGCIFAELLNNNPLFGGLNDIDQLVRVISVLGSPEEVWGDVRKLPDYGKIQFPWMPLIPWTQVCPDAAKGAVDLLGKFLQYEGKKRIGARDAMLETYFFEEPLAAHHLEMPPCYVEDQEESEEDSRLGRLHEVYRGKERFDTATPLDLHLFGIDYEETSNAA